jgi:hypothetical protein
MSFFYDLNKRLNGLRADDKQINEDVAKAAAKVKSPARVSLEESLAGDLKSLMEGQVNELSQSTKDSYTKKAKTELDIYNRNKNNPGASAKDKEMAAKSAARREKGLSRVSEEEKMADKDYDGDGKVETGKAEVMGSRMKAAAKAGNLEELSSDTLKSYAKKAANSAANKGAELGQKMAAADEVDRYTNRHFPKGVDQFGQRDAMRKAAGADYDDINKTRSKAAKRVAGIGRAVDRLANEDVPAQNYSQQLQALEQDLEDANQNGSWEDIEIAQKALKRFERKHGYDAHMEKRRAGTNEDDMGEGNEFSGELVKAKAMGKKEFEVDGKEYKVKEDGTGGMNFSGSGSLEEGEASFAMMDAAKDFAKKWMKRYPGNPNETEAKHYDEYEKFADAFVTNALNKNGIKVTPITLEKSRSDFDYYLKQEYDMLSESKTKSYSAKNAAAGKDIGKPGKNFAKIEKSAGGGEKGKKIAGAVLAKLRAAKESIQEADDELAADKIEAASKKDFKGIKKAVMKNRHEKELDEAGLPDIVDKQAKMDIAKGKKPGSMKNVMRGLKAFVKGTAEPMDESDDEMIGYLQKKAGSMTYNAGSGKPDAHNGMMFEMDPGQLIDAVLEQIKQDVQSGDLTSIEELLKSCPAEALSGYLPEEMGEGAYYNPGLEALAAKKRAEREAKQKQTDEGYADMDAYLKSLEAEKGTGKFDSRKTSTGTVYTRKPETFASDDDSDMPAVARGRGRPAVAKKPERVTSKAWKHKEVEEHGSGVENMKGKSWQSSKAGAHPWNEDEEINEKAEAGKREFFDKLAPAAKKVAKVVNKMTKGKEKAVAETTPAKKPAADKEQGAKIPEVGLTKVNAKGVEQKKKVKETTTAGSVDTAPASNTTGDSSVGKGIYDSYNRDVEKLISESFTVNMSKTITDNGQNQSNINISATDEDADMLKELLLNAGIDISGKKEESCCPACGATPCACGGDVEVDPVADGFAVGVISAPDEMGHDGHMEFELDEADAPVTQNSPDYPTNQEYSNDPLQYSGGLNKPKSTGQTTTPVIASQLKRQMSEADSFLNLYQSFKAIK